MPRQQPMAGDGFDEPDESTRYRVLHQFGHCGLSSEKASDF
jgi:hypothetical protein